jgi:hypothetical protein
MAYLIIFLGTLLRIVPHAANFAPIGAIALFGGVYLDKKIALVVSLATMIISDFFIGFDSIPQRAVVYGAFILIGLVGVLIRRKKNVWTVLGGSLSASVIFFLVTNCVYLYSPDGLYGHSLSQQILSYTNALPFFRNTFVSDLLYVSAFFGAYEAVAAWKEKKSHVVYNQSQS